LNVALFSGFAFVPPPLLTTFFIVELIPVIAIDGDLIVLFFIVIKTALPLLPPPRFTDNPRVHVPDEDDKDDDDDGEDEEDDAEIPFPRCILLDAEAAAALDEGLLRSFALAV
jgi:hypothetical protein